VSLSSLKVAHFRICSMIESYTVLIFRRVPTTGSRKNKLSSSKRYLLGAVLRIQPTKIYRNSAFFCYKNISIFFSVRCGRRPLDRDPDPYGSARIRIYFVSWIQIRIRIDFNYWIRIRIFSMRIRRTA
jgi:hypothetical protein